MEASKSKYSPEWDSESKDSHSLLPKSSSEAESESDLSFDRKELEHDHHSTSRRLLIHRLWWLQSSIIIFLCVLLVAEGVEHRVKFHSKCIESLTAHCEYRNSEITTQLSENIAPLLSSSFGAYETKYFNGTFLFPSIWRGKPSPKVDEAWDNLVDGKNYPIA